MKLLHIGSTGYIGAAVADALEANGHQVVPLVRRSETSTSTHLRVGDLADLPSLRDAVTEDIDGIVHTAAPSGDWSADTAAVDVLLDALGDDRVFSSTSAAPGYSVPPSPMPRRRKAHRRRRSRWSPAGRRSRRPSSARLAVASWSAPASPTAAAAASPRSCANGPPTATPDGSTTAPTPRGPPSTLTTSPI